MIITRIQQGPAGPNSVSTNTTTSLSGLLKGSGGNVAQAVAGTDYLAPGAVTPADLSLTVVYANDDDAGAGGVAIGDIYRKTDGSIAWRAVAELASIAFLGDSITSGVSGADETGDRSRGGYPGWALACGLEGLTLIRSTAGTNFQTGGYTAEQINDTWLPQVITAAPDACVVLSGANSLDDARAYSSDLDAAAAWLWAELVLTLQGLRDAGIRAIIGTLTPDNTPTDASYPPASGYYHADFRTIRAKVNALIRANAASYGAVVWEAARVYTTDASDDTALADADFLEDTIHPNYTGAWALGLSLAATVAANFKIPQLAIPASGDSGWFTPNPYMSGDVSGLATDWQIINSGGLTVNQSKDADGYQVLECTDGPLPGTNTQFQLTAYTQVTDASIDGASFKLYAELIFDADDFGYWVVEARNTLQTFDSSPATRRSYHPLQHASASIVNSGDLPDHRRRLVFQTDPIEHPGGAGSDRRRVTATLSFWGRGTVRIKTLGVVQL